MNDTEWYLIGGLIAAGVVILILLFLLFRRSSGAADSRDTVADSLRVQRLLEETGPVAAYNGMAKDPETNLPYTEARLLEQLMDVEVTAQETPSGSGSDSDDVFGTPHGTPYGSPPDA